MTATEHVLEIRGLRAGVAGKEILKGIDLTVRSGEVHAIMGPNGSGKSTLSHVVMGRPGYEVLGGTVTLDGIDLLGLAPWERAQARPVPRHAVPHRGARASRWSTCSRPPTPAWVATRPASPTASSSRPVASGSTTASCTAP